MEILYKNWFQLIKANLYNDSKTINGIINQVTDSTLSKYYSTYYKKENKEFENNLMRKTDVTFMDYVKSVKLTDDDERRNIYEKWWNNSYGMELANKVKRDTAQKNKVPSDVRNMLLTNLNNILFKQNNDKIHAADLIDVGMQTNLDVSNVIKTLEKMLHVKIIKKKSIIAWWYNMELYEVNNSFHFYLKISSEHPRTIPIHDRLCLVITPSNFNLPHEITHAIHYSLVPYYSVAKEYVEIPAMVVENKFRKLYDMEYSDNFKRLQLSLALADIDSDTPEEFNQNYEKYSNTYNAGHLCSRFWHWSNYQYIYYGYIIGLFSSADVKTLITKKIM